MLTLDKVCIDYWATEDGWKKKKKSQSDTINWKTTLAKGIGNKLNHVYERGNQTGQSGISAEFKAEILRNVGAI